VPMPQETPDAVTWFSTGEVWTVTGLLNYQDFKYEFTSWTSYDPERQARTLFDGLRDTLVNATLYKSYKQHSAREVVEEYNHHYRDEDQGKVESSVRTEE
jgi:hypothetical protein